MDQTKTVVEDFGTTLCSTVIELEIRPRIEHRDHCGVFTASGGYVGFVSLVGKHVKVQRWDHAASRIMAQRSLMESVVGVDGTQTIHCKQPSSRIIGRTLGFTEPNKKGKP